jgi:hypothetical protein
MCCMPLNAISRSFFVWLRFNEAISLHLGNTVPWMVKLVDI